VQLLPVQKLAEQFYVPHRSDIADGTIFADETITLRDLEIFQHPGLRVYHALIPIEDQLQPLPQKLNRYHDRSRINVGAEAAIQFRGAQFVTVRTSSRRKRSTSDGFLSA
jgi:hypothetical protein